MPDNSTSNSTDAISKTTIVAPRPAIQQRKNHQPVQHPNTNVQQIKIGTINDNATTTAAINNNNNSIPIQNIDEIVDNTDATVVSTLSNSVPAIYFNFDNKSNKVNIMSIIKNNIFHTYKYIRSKSDLVFQTDENSLCQMILNRLNVSEDQLIRQTCWNQIRYLVPRYLNNTRTIKLSAIKKKFFGK